MGERSLDESVDTASLSSRRQSTTRDRWTSGYQFLIFSLSCTLSEHSLVQFVSEEDGDGHGNFFQHFVGYIVIGLPIYYMQVFIGQYTQIGIISLRFICPMGHGLCYLYVVNLTASCILYSLSFVNYVVYQFTSMQKNMPWTICPDRRSECWTNDERNERCPANCLKARAKLSSYVYYERKFLAYKQDIFFLHRGMLPQSIGWILIVCLTVYAVNNQRKLLKILLVLSLSSLYLVLLASIIENGFGYVFARLQNVNAGTLLSYRSWKHVILTSINRLSLGRGFQILNGSFLSSTTQSGSLSLAAVLLDFVLTILLSTLTLQCMGIIETTAKMVDAQHKYPFRYDKNHQIYANIPQAIACMGLSHFFTVVYFFGCLILLVNHEICHLITIEKCLSDLFPSLSRYRKYVYSITCLFCFSFSVVLISTSRLIRTVHRHMTEGLINAISFNTMMTTITVFWIYGVQNLCDDVHFLTGAQPNAYWRTCWYFMPLLTTFAFAVSMQNTEPSMYWIFAVYASPFVFTGVYETFKYVRARNVMGLFEKEAQFGPPNDADKIRRKFFSPKTEIRSRRQNETCAHRCLGGSKVLQKLALEEEQRESAARGNKI